MFEVALFSGGSRDVKTAEEWCLWSDLIRSDQIPARDVGWFLAEHPDFAEWYRSTIK